MSLEVINMIKWYMHISFHLIPHGRPNGEYFLFLVGLQVTWERIQQLGDIPCARDGHTLRF